MKPASLEITSFGARLSQRSSSGFRAITALRDLPRGRLTGRPRSISQRCTVLTPRPRYTATSFQELSTSRFTAIGSLDIRIVRCNKGATRRTLALYLYCDIPNNLLNPPEYWIFPCPGQRQRKRHDAPNGVFFSHFMARSVVSALYNLRLSAASIQSAGQHQRSFCGPAQEWLEFG
jgi:hypothetical protein